ncbi:MAG: serine/threonine-protein phosphatase [Candidatus Marinimicrobia bacterium]|nr:serine/threonine-protein phosphatase [Candidatus Neomarinimicrobiota bacterium]
MKKEKFNLLKQELENFQRLAKELIPPFGEIPKLNNIDIYGESIPLNGVVGGDHIIFVDFNQRFDLESRIKQAEEMGKDDIKEKLLRNQNRAGILIADVSGHSITDAYLAGRLHDAFLTGILYELDRYGEVTTRLFEMLNTRFFESSSLDKFITLIYGEISENGKFRFITAGHPPPLVFSNQYNNFVKLSKGRLLTFPPIGMFPSTADIDKKRHFSNIGYKQKYTVNELNLLDAGDIILLYTDGLSEHQNKNSEYFPNQLVEMLKISKHLSAQDIFHQLKKDILQFAPQTDDICYIVIKKGQN